MLAEKTRAPAFTLKADSGAEILLSRYKGKKIVRCFHPKGNTPRLHLRHR